MIKICVVTFKYIYIYISLCVYVCVCACLCKDVISKLRLENKLKNYLVIEITYITERILF